MFARIRRLAVLVLAAFVAGGLDDARAVDLRDVLTGYTYTSWSRKDGLVGPVWAIAQDANGFLWVGTDAALIRFDGVRFITWESLGGAPLPRLPVRALHVGLDGTLWIGFGGGGGLARIQGRTVTTYAAAAGDVSTGTVAAITEDPAGGIWAAAAEGLFRFDGTAWQHVGAAEGLPGNGAAAVAADAESLWAASVEGLFRRPAGATRFEAVARLADGQPVPSALLADPDGRVWGTDPLIGLRLLHGPSAPSPVADRNAGRGYRLLADRDGNLWVATIGQGLWRVSSASIGSPALTVERTTLLSGLSSDAVRTVFEDRDGNIWVGTTEGVDRLVPYRVTPWTDLGLINTIDSAPDGRVWAGTADELIPFSRRSGSWQPEPTRVPLRGATALRVSPSGILWVATAAGVTRLDGVTPRTIAPPRGGFSVEALTTGPDGDAWVVATGGDIYRTDGGPLRLHAHVAELEQARTTAALLDRTGRLWLAYGGSRVGVLDEAAGFRPVRIEGLGTAVQYDLFEDREGHVWVAGASGLSRGTADTFTFAGRQNGLPAGGVYAVTQDARGDIWLATAVGLVRVEADEFDRIAADPKYVLRLRVYDTSDGLAGYPVSLGDRNAVRATDGTLWFVTSRGISVADPRLLRRERPAPLVAIDEIRVDDVRLEGIELPPGTSKLEIDFTAPELTSPLKTRFRYRLEGFDQDWVDAGTRRQALYTGLPPRQYSFHVAVSQDDGRWSEVEASFAFSMRPRFYQTWWFAVLTALTLAGITWAAWQFRERQLRQQFALVLGERVRLSRELHDTLLQSLVGVALEFDAVSKSLETSPATARERVIKIREQVEEYIREARRSIWSLRSPSLETGALVDALREAATRATAGRDVRFTLEQTGTVRRLSSTIEHQLLRIGQEALLNAARHARPSSIALRLHYTDETVTLTIADDGCGFDPAHAPAGTTDHYGLTTMRERAQQAGGRLTITSAPGQGTTVDAVIPITGQADPDDE